MPFLESLGFNSNELSFEDSFNINFGRSTYRIDTAEEFRRAGARLDILVTRNGNNLFIIEAKADDIAITDKEVAQATSYARLVHPVAPFTIITNGKSFNIYNSITRCEMDKEGFCIEDEYIPTLPDNYMYEAIKHFIGYSEANLKLFCKSHAKAGMQTLLGSRDEPDKKYIPELYKERQNFSEEIDIFFTSREKAFALIGDSGTGKTCSLCNITERLIEKHLPVFFYKACDITDDVLKIIAEDLNWTFSTQYSDIEAIGRIEEIFSNRSIIIIIDAIDEWDLPNKVSIFNRFVSKILSRNIKVILSCKSNSWNEYLTQHGTPTNLFETTYSKEKGEKGYFIKQLSPEEFSAVIDRYRNFYGFFGRFEDKVLDECKKSLFFLRVAFQVAQKHNLKDLTFSSIELFEEYYKLIIEKVANTGEEGIVKATIIETAKCMLRNNSDSVDLDVLSREIGLSPNEALLPNLFQYNILEKNEYCSVTKISFYFNKFRDYIISFHVKKWNLMTSEVFETDCEHFIFAGINEDSIQFFYPYASTEKKKVLDGRLRKKAEEYLDFYMKVIENHFPGIKHRFSPRTHGDIGFYGQLLLNRGIIGLHGFRALNNSSEDSVKFIVDNAHFFLQKTSNVAYIEGVDRLHFTDSANGFKNIDIEREVLVNEIEDQLKQIIEKGQLNEDHSKYLLEEKLFAIVFQYQAEHHGISLYSSSERYLPISYNDIVKAMHLNKAFWYYEQQLVQKKIDQGIIKVSRKGTTVTYGYSLSREDKNWIVRKSESGIKDESEFNKIIKYRDYDDSEKCLLESISHLRQSGFNEIAIKPIPDYDKTSNTGLYINYYKHETILKFLIKTYQMYLDEYKKVIEVNFSTLKHLFRLYSEMPIKAVICSREITEDSHRIMICHIRLDDGNLNEVCYADKEKIEIDNVRNEINLDDKTYKFLNISYAGASSILFNNENYVSFEIRASMTPVRALVYSTINSELSHVLNNLRSLYGVEVNSRSREWF